MKMRISRLAIHFILSFTLLGILLCLISFYISYDEYKKSIEKHYNTTAYDIAVTGASYLKEEEIFAYYEIAKAVSYGEDKENEIQDSIAQATYLRISKQLKNLKETMRANDIFLVYVNPDILLSYQPNKEWLPITYIFDCFDGLEVPFTLGTNGSINPKYIYAAHHIITTGERWNEYFISKSFHGYNISALVPIRVGEEHLILVVEIPMQYISYSLSDYLLHTLPISISVILITLFLFMIYFYRQIIHPVKIITKETQNFVKDVYYDPIQLKKIRNKTEIGVLAKSILKMEQDIISYMEHLQKVTKEQERLNTELNIATQIQKSMLPNIMSLPEQEEYCIAASMTPAKAVGGDFYDFFMIDSSHLAIVMADVSGKGIPAALFMVIGKTLLKEHTKIKADPSTVFWEVNNLLCESNKEGLFITAFEGVLDLDSGLFFYVNAGHEMPFIGKKEGGFKPYSISPDFVLAGMEDTEYHIGQIQISPGDFIFQYTDGVTEATNLHNELFGMNRLECALNKKIFNSPDEVINYVKQEIDIFVGEAPQFDDITMLCLEFKQKRREKL